MGKCFFVFIHNWRFRTFINIKNLNSQILLGNIYYNGEYVPINIKKAILYYKEASKQNCSIIFQKTFKKINLL